MTTVLVAAAVGLVVGAGGAGGFVYWQMRIRCDLHDYRKVALEAARVRQVYADADHEHRLRRRWEAKARELRGCVGPLLDTVARQRREIARLSGPRHRRRYPLDYGIHRSAA